MSYSWGSLVRKEAVAENGMVVSKHPLASRAGVEILEKGGNAIDAAAATGFALMVVEPHMSTLGGVGWIVVRLADGDTDIILGAGKAPLKATPDMFELEPEGYGPFYRRVKNDANVYGHRAVAIPGLLAALAMMLDKYGNMDLEEVMQPAIGYAEDGFIVSLYDTMYISQMMGVIARFPETAKLVLRNGFPPRLARRDEWDGAERIRQEELAKSLRNISKGGPEVFYNGEIANAIARDMEEHSGLVAEKDLATYEPKVLKARPGSYRAKEVVYVPELCGGPLLMEVLNILEGFDLRAMGHNTSQTLHVLAEAMGLAYSDYYGYVGDPDFVRVPQRGMTSKEYAVERRGLIDVGRASVPVKPGNPWPHEGDFTTHHCAADKEGNVTSITQTIGGLFGSIVTVPDTGIILNNQMFGFNPQPGFANSIAPGKFRTGPPSPTIITDGQKPVLSVGAVGGPRIPLSLAQVIMNVIDHGMGIQAAIEAPRIDRGSVLRLADQIFVDSRIEGSVRDGLLELGHTLTVVDEQPWVPGGYENFATPIGMLLDPRTGRFHGGVDPYRPGQALGY
jgi:gamma-glutamyltranspeptidase/glutathione hydrolase